MLTILIDPILQHNMLLFPNRVRMVLSSPEEGSTYDLCSYREHMVLFVQFLLFLNQHKLHMVVFGFVVLHLDVVDQTMP